MATYELKEKTETNGEVWYFIHKDGKYVDYTYTTNIDEASQMLDKYASGEQNSEPIIKVIKTIEVDEKSQTETHT